MSHPDPLLLRRFESAKPRSCTVVVRGYLNGLYGMRCEGQDFFWFHKSVADQNKNLLLLALAITAEDDPSACFEEVFVLAGAQTASMIQNHWVCGDFVEIQGDLIYSLPASMKPGCETKLSRWPVPLLRAVKPRFIRPVENSAPFFAPSLLIQPSSMRRLQRLEQEVAFKNALIDQYSAQKAPVQVGLFDDESLALQSKSKPSVSISAESDNHSVESRDNPSPSTLAEPSHEQRFVQTKASASILESRLDTDKRLQLSMLLDQQMKEWLRANDLVDHECSMPVMSLNDLRAELKQFQTANRPSLFFEMLYRQVDVVPF